MNLETVLLFVIDQTSKIAKQYSEREFELLGIDITVEQWLLLKIIEEKDTLSQTELAKNTHRDPASITRTLDILQKKNLIVRKAVASNRRQYDVELTTEGREFVAKNMPIITKLRNKSIEGLSEIEVKTLMELLHKIQNNMK